ncbi:MAG: ATP-binding protein, partial [Rhodococcus sp. (in: high G+C Gram-positive bacteria)]|uniref:ATP-binding protein n=1 Tax=Rhodococcus sp. TaxID=1831 RepID=UPI003BB635F4
MGNRGAKSLNLMNWRLSYKLGLVLIIPMIAAAVFGALRVSDQLDDDRRFSLLSDQLAVIPALFEFSNIVVSTSTAASLGLPVDPATAGQIDSSSAKVSAFSKATDFNPTVTERVSQLLEDGQALYDTFRGGTMPVDELKRRTADFLVVCEATFRSVLDLAENTEMQTAGTNVINVWNSQLTMLDQVNSIGMFYQSPEAARAVAFNALNLEESTINLLRGTPIDNGKVDELLGKVANKRALFADFDPARQSPVVLSGEIKSAYALYQSMHETSVAQISITVDRLSDEARTAAIQGSIAVAVILAVALAVALLVARTLSVPLRRLREGVLGAANHELPAAIAAVKDGADVTTVELAPIDVHTTEEIGELARAVDSMNSEALRLASEQAHLRQQVSTMLETLARRNKTLVEQQLSLIDSLEYEEKDPARLQSLFALDHLAARMRRTGDSLLVLSGTRPRTRSAPAPLGDVLRGAVSQVENYQRVRIGNTPQGYLVGGAVADVVHMLAELVDNALRASPPNSAVTFEFSAAVDGGLLLEIADSGIGTAPEV